MEDYKLRATDAQQYDLPDLDWRITGDVDDSSRLFFRNFLKQDLEDLKGKRVLDIGSGVGQLFPMLKEFGASDIVGLEPSKRSVEYSQGLYPDVEIQEGTLATFHSDNIFDVAICIMAFEHIFDIEAAFSQIATLLRGAGSFYLMIGDKDFHSQDHYSKTHNFMVSVDVQELGNGVIATKTIYPTAVIYDIFRPLEAVLAASQKAGFELKKKIGMTLSRESPSCHFLIFNKI